MIWFLLFLLIVLGVGLIVSIYYLLRFAKIILILEDDLSEAIETLTKSEQTLNQILSMRLFFDSPEVKMVVMDAMQDIKLCKIAVEGVIRRFVQRSKQKYVKVVEVEPVMTQIVEPNEMVEDERW